MITFLHVIGISVGILVSVLQDRRFASEKTRYFAHECMTIASAHTEQTIRGTKARVYGVTQTQAKVSPSIVIGQLSFHSYPLYVLIDSSATHNFVTQGIIERLGRELTHVDTINIKMLNKDKILSNQMLLSETMFLRGR